MSGLLSWIVKDFYYSHDLYFKNIYVIKYLNGARQEKYLEKFVSLSSLFFFIRNKRWIN